MPDYWESQNGLDLSRIDSWFDNDTDGLNNLSEYLAQTDPWNNDSDNDGLLDGEEAIEIKGYIEFPCSYVTSEAIATNGSSYLIAWTDGDYFPYIQLFDLNGTEITGIIELFDNESLPQTRCDCPIAVASNGTDYLVMWSIITAENSHYKTLVSTRISSSGEILDDPLLEISPGHIQRTSVASDGTNYYLVWGEIYSSGELGSVKLMGILINADGTFQQSAPTDFGFQCSALLDLKVIFDGTNYVIGHTRSHSRPSLMWPSSAIKQPHIFRMSTDGILLDQQSLCINTDYSKSYSFSNLFFNGTNILCLMWDWDDEFCIRHYTDDGNFLENNLVTTDVLPYGFSDNEYISFSFSTYDGSLSSFPFPFDPYDTEWEYIYFQLLDLNLKPIGIPFKLSTVPYYDIPTLFDLKRISTASTANSIGMAWIGQTASDERYLYAVITETSHNTNPLSADTDSDGLTDYEEVQYGYSAILTDTDYDEIDDLYEHTHGMNPADAADASLDPDNDGLTNKQEILIGTDRLGNDTDNDGMPDGYEIANNLNPFQADSGLDSDNDGIINLDEYNHQTRADKQDTDGDRINDYDEINVYTTNPINKDSDNDFLHDGLEILMYHTNPLTADCDNDGLLDGEEIIYADNDTELQITNLLPFYVTPYLSADTSKNTILFSYYEQDNESDETIKTFYQFLDTYGSPAELQPELFYSATAEEFIEQEPYHLLKTSITYTGNDYLIFRPYFYNYSYTSLDYFGNLLYISGYYFSEDPYVSGSILFHIDSNFIVSPTTGLKTSTLNGKTLAVWTGYGGDYYINVNIFFDDASFSGHELHIADGTDTTEIQVTANNDDFLVTYNRDKKLYGRRISTSRQLLGSEIIIDSCLTPSTLSEFHDTASDGKNYYVVWQEDDPDYSYRINLAVLDNEGNILRTDIAAYGKNMPVIASNGTTVCIVYRLPYSPDCLYGKFLYPATMSYSAEFFIAHLEPGSLPSVKNLLAFDDHYTLLYSCYDYNSGGSTLTQYIRSANLYPGYGTDPLMSDSDNDSLSDVDEITRSINPLNPDSDNDGLDDAPEINIYATNPLKPDTDNDGMNDGNEVKAGMEPDNAESLFQIIYCNYEHNINQIMLQWQGSKSNPELPYKILWSDNLSLPWHEAVTDTGDVLNDNGIRTWFDEGDNESAVPREIPDESTSRYYKIFVE